MQNWHQMYACTSGGVPFVVLSLQKDPNKLSGKGALRSYFYCRLTAAVGSGLCVWEQQSYPAQLLVLQSQNPCALCEQLHLDGGQRVCGGEVPLGSPAETHNTGPSAASLPVTPSI